MSRDLLSPNGRAAGGWAGGAGEIFPVFHKQRRLLSSECGEWAVDRDQTVLGPRHYGNTLYQHFHSQHQYSLYSILFMFMCVLQSEHYSGFIVVKL